MGVIFGHVLVIHDDSFHFAWFFMAFSELWAPFDKVYFLFHFGFLCKCNVLTACGHACFCSHDNENLHFFCLLQPFEAVSTSWDNVFLNTFLIFFCDFYVLIGMCLAFVA